MAHFHSLTKLIRASAQTSQLFRNTVRLNRNAFQDACSDSLASRSEFFPRRMFTDSSNKFTAINVTAPKAITMAGHSPAMIFLNMKKSASVAKIYANISRQYTPSIVKWSQSAAAAAAQQAGGHASSAVAATGSSRAVSVWLFGCAGWVFSMVVLGGVTRLTRSGLSMTDWKFTGGLPPMTSQEWEVEFDKYKMSPEYKRVNLGMKLEEFKFIYWMEYAHRMWGRALGLVFLVPFAYFSARGQLTPKLRSTLLVLGCLGGGQGLVGWWMVKSGLQEPTSETAIPRVSPYRLASHLASAFVIYSGLFWTALNVASPQLIFHTSSQLAGAAKLRPKAHWLAAVAGITALSGAFVAGNDAGHAYNTFPKMGDDWIPPSVLEMTPVLRNFFENTATVQLDHRVLATVTTVSAIYVWLAARSLDLPLKTRLLVHSSLAMTGLQVTLGISTLLMYVPVSLGSAHQAGALTLFTILLSLLHTLRRRPSPALASAAFKRVKIEVNTKGA